MKALVTGYRGFVGRAFYATLFDLGYTVHGMDIADPFTGDIRKFFRDDPGEHFDLVVHCAAVVGGRTMIEGEPLKLAVEDLSIDAELFRWAMRARPGRIVYFSSSAAYPVRLQVGDSGVRLSEYSYLPGECDQTYGWVKQTGERLAAEANAIGIKTHVFRPFSGYGETQDDAYPFPAIIKRCLANRRVVPIWSNATRDFIHIEDIVGAVLAAIDQDFLEPVNLCTGRAVRFRSLAYMAGAHSVIIEPGHPQGVSYRVGDPTKMLGFYQPKVTIEEGVARALAAVSS